MSKHKKPSPEAPQAKKPFPIPKGTIIGAVTFALALYMATGSYKEWNVLRTRLNGLEADFQKLSARNAQLAPAFQILQNRKFSVCNRTPDLVHVNSVSAAYHDGRSVLVFDSSRCSDWKSLAVPSGSSKVLNLSSSEPGCNWNGNVMYFAMQYSRESEDEISDYDFVGVYNIGDVFDRDCFNVE